MTSESEKRHGRVGALRNWRMLAAGLAVVVVAFGCLTGAALADGWYETWDDGNDVNAPLDWEHPALFSGTYDASSGNYFLKGDDIQEPFGAVDNDDEILSTTATGGDEFQSFAANVSVRVRARMDGPGNIGAAAFGDISVPKGYGVFVDDEGGMEMLVFSANPADLIGILRLKEGDLPLDPGTRLTDVYVQLDSVATEDSNATMSMTVWTPGLPQPVEPQLLVDISNDTNDEGFPLAWVLDKVPPVGPSGIVFNEEPGENEGDPEGTGTFFWALAQTNKLINADINRDGEVNGLDVDPFVDVVLNGPFDPLADMNSDGEVNGLDVDPFVAAVVGGGAQPAGGIAGVPEPSTLVLALLALVGGACCAMRRRDRP